MHIKIYMCVPGNEAKRRGVFYSHADRYSQERSSAAETIMVKSGKLLLSLLAALLLASGQPAPPPVGSAPACSIPPPSPGSLPEALVHPADATEQTPG